MLTQRTADTKDDAPRLVLIADDVDATYRELLAKDVHFTTPPTKAPWNPGQRLHSSATAKATASSSVRADGGPKLYSRVPTPRCNNHTQLAYRTIAAPSMMEYASPTFTSDTPRNP